MNILIVGVGGQGTLLTSRVLGKYAEMQGMDCKLSEVHGMSQRGGSVVTHVRIANEVFSPTIWEGSADLILAFEKLEALRYLHYLKKDGAVLVNDMEIYPMPVINGSVKYPENILGKLAEKANVKALNAADVAKEAGNIKALNIVMVGALTAIYGLDHDVMRSAVEACVPAKFAALNLTAFEMGFDKGQQIK